MYNFFIKKGATLPILQMELIPDVKHNYNNFFELIQNSDITFSMYNEDTNLKKVYCKEALCSVKLDVNSEVYERYLLTYKFTDRDTNTVGTFIGEFTINFEDEIGKLIVPIKNQLKIHVIE